MKKLFLSTNAFDERAEKFGLESKILMQNAAISLANEVRKNVKKGSKILGVAGGGNNGADVIAALRILQGDYESELFLSVDKLKPLAEFELDLALKFGVKQVLDIGNKNAHKCVIDGIFGSGLNKNLDDNQKNLITCLNPKNAYKIACDFPSGLDADGRVRGACFCADVTIAMGGLKLGLFSDAAKEFVGRVKRARLGLSDVKFQGVADGYLLQKKDIRLPFRRRQNTNKGDFGHAFFVCGELSGAAYLAALAAQKIGAGLVSLISQKEHILTHPELMMARKISAKMNAGAVGMGLSDSDLDALDINVLKDKKLVLDASLCRFALVLDLLNVNSVVTPHPREFCSLLRLAGIADLQTSSLQENRFKYAKIFTQKFACTLVLKGANTIIARRGRLFVARHGTSALAKGGSGDVLSGIIAGLMAQGFSPFRAAVTGVLTHALSARNFSANNYALTPKDIIKGLKWLKK